MIICHRLGLIYNDVNPHNKKNCRSKGWLKPSSSNFLIISLQLSGESLNLCNSHKSENEL